MEYNTQTIFFRVPIFFQPHVVLFQTPLFRQFESQLNFEPTCLHSQTIATTPQQPQTIQKQIQEAQFHPQKACYSTAKRRSSVALKKAEKATGKKETQAFTEQRNIIPNNVNHILSFIQRKKKSEKVVERIIAKFGKGKSTYSTKGFFTYMAYLKQTTHIHVNRDTLKTLVTYHDSESDIFNVEEQEFYNKVSRCLIDYYLREMAKLKVLSSMRVKETNKIDHLRAQRTLLDLISATPSSTL